MTIYRGPGGTGSATSDADTTLYQEFLNQTLAARDAALQAETNAETAEANAETAETNAETAATNAASSASAAATSASNASTSATNAASSASAAATSATNAANSATAAASSAIDAANSAATVAASLSNYYDKTASDARYSQLGHKHNLSDLNQSGASTGQIPEWNGTAWVPVTPAPGGVTSFNTRTGAVTLTSSDVTGVNGVVTTGSYADPAWITSLDDGKVLPTMTGNSGKYLTNDGTNSSWATLNTDANSTTKGLYEHSNTISANYTISSGNNAMSAGPVTVASGVSVTVPSGSVWTII